MLSPDLLKLLRCPVTGEALNVADPELTASINQAIAAGNARDTLDMPVLEPVQGGLVSRSLDLFYPIREEIPCLIVDEAVSTRGLVRTSTTAS